MAVKGLSTAARNNQNLLLLQPALLQLFCSASWSHSAALQQRFSFRTGKVFQRDYSNFDKQALVTDIQSINWNVLLRDVYERSSMFDSLYIKISEVIDTHIPIKQLSRQELKSRSKPWITSGIRTSIRIKNGLSTKFLKTKSTYYHAGFKVYRNKLNHFINLSKRSYYNNFFSIHVHVNNGKRIWQGIK